MSGRKALPKKIRFEVFKRDKFTCQYCGASAPDVILEVDHIIPVSKGGTDELLNLVTSCRDCNRGKTNKLLADDSTLKMQKKQLAELQEKREQMEMLIAWKKELMAFEDTMVNTLMELVSMRSGFNLTDSIALRNILLKHMKKFGFEDVYEGISISFDQYYDDTDKGFLNTIQKIGGICYNRKKQRKQDAE